ncbi:hypothetical protein AB5I41_14430 [Sphingomonas sp. MMS24-JH45]
MLVREGEAERLAAAGLEFASDEELDRCVMRLRAAGARAEEDVDLGKTRGVLRLVRSEDPAGCPLELVVGRTLGVAVRFVRRRVAVRHRGQWRNGPRPCRPPAPDIEASRTFWLETMGLGLTDTMSFVLARRRSAEAVFHALRQRAAPFGRAVRGPVPIRPDPCDAGGRINSSRHRRFIDRCERDGVHVASLLGRHSDDQDAFGLRRHAKQLHARIRVRRLEDRLAQLDSHHQPGARPVGA